MGEIRLDKWIDGFSDDIIDVAKTSEERGSDCIWVTETGHDPFLSSLLVAEYTEDVAFGTRIATAFSRSPMQLAYSSWDLARYSGGRFVLGLGTQVKGHNENRFSVEHEPPGPRLREVIESIRHIWDVFQGEEDELDYQGEYYSFSLMTDVFNPGPIEHPEIPIYISAVNDYNVRLAGELCDGIALHPVSSVSYVEEIVLERLEEGIERGGRSREDVEVSASPFIITGRDESEIQRHRERVRARFAFYASTPAYKPVLEHHGWTEIGRTLYELSRNQQWDEMADHVTDEMLDAFSVQAPIDELEDAVEDTFGAVADRVVVSPEPNVDWEISHGLYVELD